MLNTTSAMARQLLVGLIFSRFHEGETNQKNPPVHKSAVVNSGVS